MQLIFSHQSNSSLLNESCDPTAAQIENGSTVHHHHIGDVEVLKKLNHNGQCVGNFNNNFLTNNNNMNNNNNNNHKSDTSNNNDHKSGQCIELKAATAATATAIKTATTTNATCSATKSINRSDDENVAVIRHEIDIEGDVDVDDDDVEDDGGGGGGGTGTGVDGDVIETDTRSSSKSNFSNIDVECERDERKPNVKSFSGIMQSVAQDSSSSGWISCSSPTDKLINNDAAIIYTNCGAGDAAITHSPASNNGCNLMVNNFKKEVSHSSSFF